MNDSRTPAWEALLHALAGKHGAATFRAENPFHSSLRALRLPLVRLPAGAAGLSARLQERLEAWRHWISVRRPQAIHARIPQPGQPFAALHRYTHQLDALHRLAWSASVQELPCLVRLEMQALQGELEVLLRMQPPLPVLRTHPRAAPSPAQKAYALSVQAAQNEEHTRREARIATLKELLQGLQQPLAEADFAHKRLVFFARGGYGRGEMSPVSDVDTGSCLDAAGLSAGHRRLLQRLITRISEYMGAAELSSAHQFLELGESLERFTHADTLYTLNALLEGRFLAGNAALLCKLQEQVRHALPLETFIQRKRWEYEGAPRFAGWLSDTQQAGGVVSAAAKRDPSHSRDLKQVQGGLRTIQTPLWILGAMHRIKPMHTANLLRYAWKNGLLKENELGWLLRALVLLHALRGKDLEPAAEARAGAVSLRELPAALEQARTIADRLLMRVLQHKLTLRVGDFQVVVHLGRREVLALQALPQERALQLSRSRVLALFAYLAETGHRCAATLETDLAAAIPHLLRMPSARQITEAERGLWQRLVAAPWADQAFATLFAIRNPFPTLPVSHGPVGCGPLMRGYFATEAPSLAGCLLPILESASNAAAPNEPRETHNPHKKLPHYITRCLRRGREALEVLADEHADLHRALSPAERRACFWSLLLHALPAPVGAADAHSSAAQAAWAADLALCLGEEEETTALVRLLVEHHSSLCLTTRMSNHLDQALARCLEIAQRSLVRLALLYVVNLAVLEAEGRPHRESLLLRRLFAQAVSILETRTLSAKAPQEGIRDYLAERKQEHEAALRWLLLRDELLDRPPLAVIVRLRRSLPALWRTTQERVTEIEAWRAAVLSREAGASTPGGESRFIAQLCRQLGLTGLRTLTQRSGSSVSWFFAAFPDRYLLTASPQALAGQLVRFRGYASARALAALTPSHLPGFVDLLLFVQGLSSPHLRVAATLVQHGVRIVSGKINPIHLASGRTAYSYYFQLPQSAENLLPEASLLAHELARGSSWHFLADSHTAAQSSHLNSASSGNHGSPHRDTAQGEERSHALRVTFETESERAYEVVPAGKGYERRRASLGELCVDLPDAPWLLHRTLAVLTHFGVELRQAIISTTGQWATDRFYFSLADCERLERLGFAERLAEEVFRKDFTLAAEEAAPSAGQRAHMRATTPSNSAAKTIRSLSALGQSSARTQSRKR